MKFWKITIFVFSSVSCILPFFKIWKSVPRFGSATSSDLQILKIWTLVFQFFFSGRKQIFLERRFDFETCRQHTNGEFPLFYEDLCFYQFKSFWTLIQIHPYIKIRIEDKLFWSNLASDSYMFEMFSTFVTDSFCSCSGSWFQSTQFCRIQRNICKIVVRRSCRSLFNLKCALNWVNTYSTYLCNTWNAPNILIFRHKRSLIGSKLSELKYVQFTTKTVMWKLSKFVSKFVQSGRFLDAFHNKTLDKVSLLL